MNSARFSTKVCALPAIFLVVLICHFMYSSTVIQRNKSLIHAEDNVTKKILFWNKGYADGLTILEPGGEDFFRNLGCPIWQCEICSSWNQSSERIRVEDYDALVFFDPTWAGKIPTKRATHQHYIWLNREAPSSRNYIKKWNRSAGFFNWTLTYRLDSDFVATYGYFRPLIGNEVVSKETNYAKGKSKMAIWFVSNCNKAKSGRLDYVHRLQKHIHVDIYGACGPFNCPRQKENECRAMMERDYKFVIAFENSLCLDYITEKLFLNMKYNIIPIVLDLHGNVARFAPVGSYINALDFQSVKKLADYLKILDGNDTLYNQHFKWKEHYDVIGDHRGLCKLCSKLHNPSRPVNVIKNLTKWWKDEAKCKMLQFSNDTWSSASDLQ